MTVTVAVPFYGAPELLERCIRSVLGQTHRDLHCVVVGDGQKPKLRIRDGRLDLYTLPENRGTYFVSQLILEAVRHRWYALVGADDWLEPEHLGRLMDIAKEGQTAIAQTAVVWHQGDAETIHRGSYVVGMFRKARLVEIGGFNPAERIGQDTLTLRLLRLTGGLAEAHEPTYHRVRRPDSLTTAELTRIGSPERNAMRGRNRAVFAACGRLRTAEAIRAYRASLIPSQVRDELAEQTARLAGLVA